MSQDIERVDATARRMTQIEPAVVPNTTVRIDVSQRAVIARLKGVEAVIRALCHLARAQDHVIHRDEHAASDRLRGRRDPDRAQQVLLGIRPEGRRRPLGTDEHDRPLGGDGQVQKVRRLLQRRRTMGDGDARDRGVFEDSKPSRRSARRR
ncbi:hypothetical protein NQ152_11410 [Microbacterium sp. zg.B48]|nr:hypothetical protein [Microbacterium sp. zg.B48]MCR2764111.1 hypothetical protein [Microbacterium sp. zg.B48]